MATLDNRRSVKDKDKIEKLKNYDEAKYKNIDLDHLVMYAISELEKMKVDLSFENAVVVSFKLFPKKFSLPGFPGYPDGKRIHDCLFRCTYKAKQWLGGKTRQGYIITDRSRNIIKESEKLLKKSVFTSKTRTTSQTRRKELILAEILSSSAYLKYIQEQGDSITEGEFCFLLQGTLDSSKETLKENFISLKMFAEESNREEILKFLIWLENRFGKKIKF